MTRAGARAGRCREGTDQTLVTLIGIQPHLGPKASSPPGVAGQHPHGKMPAGPALATSPQHVITPVIRE